MKSEQAERRRGSAHRRSGAHRADRRRGAGSARHRVPGGREVATPPGQADKAIGVHCRTMEIGRSQGIVGEAMDAGIWLTGQTVFVNGEQTHRMSWELPELPYAHLGLPQYETERILTERLATLGVRPQRGAELIGFTQDEDGGLATLADRRRRRTRRYERSTWWAATARTARSASCSG